MIYEPKEMANTVAELVFIPAPGVGHVMSAIGIAKLLVNRDERLSIKVLIFKPPRVDSGSAINTYIESLAENPMDRISFIELPHDENPSARDPKAPMTTLDDFIKSHCKYVRNVVAELTSQPGFGRLTGFVIDMFCTSMIDVAKEFNVPTYIFFTFNASFLGFFLYIQILNDDHNQDLVELSNSDTEISVPTFVKPLPTKHFWSLVQTREGADFALQSSRIFREVKAIIVNTYLELETYAIKSLSADTNIPPVYPVGPILNLEGSAAKPLDDDVIRWLDSQPSSSVVFLCFGSMGSFGEAQVKEIAHGLERSGHRFLWSLRRPPTGQTSRFPGDYEDPGVVLPVGFLERTAERGKVIGWAPQVTLLGHRAVGGFVSHCGWNSLLESLWFGVPVATWPIYAEQQMNAFEMVEELGLAVELTLDYRMDMFNPDPVAKTDTVIVTSGEIESGIRRVMEDNEVRTKVKDISEKGRAALAEGGSSYAAIGRLIQDIIRNVS